MAFNPNKSPNPKTHRHQRGLSPSNFSSDSGMESRYLMSPHEHNENRRLFARDNDSSPETNFANSQNRRVLTERNLNCFSAPRERKSPNSEIDFGSALLGDSPKPSRIQSEEETECGCELGSVLRSNSNSNIAKSRAFQSPERGRTRSELTQNEKFDSDFEFKSETGEIREFDFGPLHRVSSVGNLERLESKFELGSGQRRSASPNLRNTPNHEMGLYSPSFRSESRRKTNEFRCNCELGSSEREFRKDQSPIFGSFQSSIYVPKTNYLSPKPQFLCSRSKSKSQFRNSPFFSHYSQEKSNIDSLSKKPEKVRSKTERPSVNSKSNLCFCNLIKLSIFWGVFIVGVLFVKEVPFLSSNLGSNLFFRKNLTDLSLNPEYLGDFPRFNEEFENRELNLDQEIEISELDQNLGEKKEKEDYFVHEIEEKVEKLVLKNPVLVEEEKPTEYEEIEKDKKKEIPVEEITYFEEIQSELDENEINSEKTEVFNEFEKPISDTTIKIDLIDSCVVSVPVPTGTKEKEEEKNNDALRIRFSMAFICVALCASLISCFIKREPFGEILKRNYYSSKNGEKGSKKRSRDEKVLSIEESYGSFLTYEKIPIKKRFGEEEGLMTPVRRSSRIRNHITSPS